jgi:hypothetical protein
LSHDLDALSEVLRQMVTFLKGSLTTGSDQNGSATGAISASNLVTAETPLPARLPSVLGVTGHSLLGMPDGNKIGQGSPRKG